MHNGHVNQFSLRQRRLGETSLDGDEGTSGGWEIPVRATQSDRVELAEVLAQIAKLPVEQREVLILAAVEELRYEDIARVQGVPIGTVMSRLNRAREAAAHAGKPIGQMRQRARPARRRSGIVGKLERIVLVQLEPKQPYVLALASRAERNVLQR